MFTLQQLERRVALLDMIDQYKRLISRDSLRTATYDSPSGGCAYKPDTLGETVVQQERRRAKLAQLEALEAIQRPEVEKTLKAASALQARGAIKIEISLRMRYLYGWDWPEISERLHIKNPEKISAAALNRLERMEDNT